MSDDIDWLEEKEELDIEFNSLRGRHIKVGFREGVNAGEDYILQTSFDHGFKKSASYYEKLAKYRGFLSAILMFLSMEEKCTLEVRSKIEKAMLELEQLEDNVSHDDAILEERNSLSNLAHLKCENIVSRNNQSVNESEIDDLTAAMEINYTVEKNEDVKCDVDGGDKEMCVTDCCMKGNKLTDCGSRHNGCDCTSHKSVDSNNPCCSGVKCSSKTHALRKNIVVGSSDDIGDSHMVVGCSDIGNSHMDVSCSDDIDDSHTEGYKSEIKLKETIDDMQSIVLDILNEITTIFDPMILMNLNGIINS